MARKTDNDALLQTAGSSPDQPRQLSLIQFVPKPKEKDPAFEKVLAAVRAEAQEFEAIARELYPSAEWLEAGLKKAPLPEYKAVCDEYYRRHPDQIPKTPVFEPRPLPEGEYKIFSVRWGNSYTQPPNGLPEVLYRFTSEMDCPTKRQRAKMDAILQRAPAGYVYAIGFGSQAEDRGDRKWTLERKIKNRRRLLENRIKKKFSIPELYEEALHAALMRNPEYYGVEPLKIPLVLKTPEYELIEVKNEQRVNQYHQYQSNPSG